MNDLETALAEQRVAVETFLAAARRVGDAVWSVPLAAGKWSPAQITDHVAVGTRLAQGALAGSPAAGGFPRLLRWLPRKLYFERVLVRGFPLAGKGPAAFAPAKVPGPREDLLARLSGAVAEFEAAARAAVAVGRVAFEHGFFGRIGVADYVRFNARHLDHHRAQLPAG